MVELDGIQYEVNTPLENATNAVNYINQYCAANNIVNTKGEAIFIDANMTNPLFVMLYGVGYLVSIIQRLVYNLGRQFNIAAASESQLLELGNIAGIQRKPASKTVINVNIQAKDTEDCVIAPSLSATVQVDGVPIIFHPAYDVTIPAGQNRTISLLSEAEGVYSIPAGSITSFDTPVEGLDHIVSQASIPGTNQETIADYRLRLQRRGTQVSRIDACKAAIESLYGVSRCNIFFNYSTSRPTTSGETGFIIPPRKALMIIQGYNEKIPEVYFNYLLCETTLPEEDPDHRFITLNYNTKSGQVIPVHFASPRQTLVEVTIHVGVILTEVLTVSIKSVVVGMAATQNIGGFISAADIIKTIEEQLPLTEVTGVSVKRANTINTGTYRVDAKPDELLILDKEHVIIASDIGEVVG